ncbi:MAG: hypothetical protein WBP61_19130 [Nocardioides sp.]
MTTHVSTSNPVRSDIDTTDRASTARPGRAWTLAGIGAGLAGIGTIVTSGMVDAVYHPDVADDPTAILDRLADQTGPMLAFHTFAMIAAVLLVVFAAGLFRRLRATAGETSIAPLVAFSGLLGTAIVTVMGSGLDTEFIFAFMGDQPVDPANAALFNHWIGTIPWIWALAGLSGLAVYVLGRAGAAPRWIGRVGLVLGGLTLLLGISPLQYMAGMTGPLWLLVTALGFCFGDRAHR